MREREFENIRLQSEDVAEMLVSADGLSPETIA